MALLSDLKNEVKQIFAERWNEAEAQIVPEPENLRLSNDARHFERATILYADLSGSTKLVDNYSWQIAGEIYKAYLLCAAKIIRSLDGEITAYDGDRIMAVFMGDSQTTHAAKCGLQINWAVANIVNPALKAQYSDTDYAVKQVVGIDTSEIRAARIGVRGGNDLVWIGRGANYAAKLTECRPDYSTWMTEEAFNRTSDSSKYSSDSSRQLMWKEFTWTQMHNHKVYGSSWRWSLAD
jgi:class 3 adenylate cyclase